MNTRLVAAFRGEVQCRCEAGAVRWRLRGRDREGGEELEVLLGGGADLQLPERVTDAELHVRAEPDGQAWELHVAGGARALMARTVQVHRGAAAAFGRALPRVVAPWTMRAGWALLLAALRVPGMARLLQRVRGGSAAP
ncbi:MAG TPA: hypothetical protein VMT49_07860 [Steroidobacteraceae bacterium]|nr:hypothetical protein [Steroidobacteraceae bacterium]